MKQLLLFSLVIVITFAQHPIPLPNFNLEKIQGEWWLAALFLESSTVQPNLTCVLYNFTADSDGAWLNQTFVNNGVFGNMSTYYTYEDNNTAYWEYSQSDLIWIALDPIAGQWSTIVAATPFGGVLSRTQSISQLVYHGQTLLLNAEGYYANSSNFWILDNTNCPQNSS